MKSILTLVYSIFILSQSALAFELMAEHEMELLGGDKGNGGDTITCYYGPSKSTYFLDYLSAMLENPTAGYYTSTQEVIDLLKEKIPYLAKDLEDIEKSFNTHTRKGRYIWKNLAPREVRDEELSFEIPSNCEQDPEQLILRRKLDRDRTYFFAKRIKMKSLGAQISWALLHEVLWQFYNSALEIRIVNEFIHNKENSSLSSEEFIDEINMLVSPFAYIDHDTHEAFSRSEKLLNQSNFNF